MKCAHSLLDRTQHVNVKAENAKNWPARMSRTKITRLELLLLLLLLWAPKSRLDCARRETEFYANKPAMTCRYRPKNHQNSKQKTAKIIKNHQNPYCIYCVWFFNGSKFLPFCPVAWHHATRPHLPPGYFKALRVKITMFNRQIIRNHLQMGQFLYVSIC